MALTLTEIQTRFKKMGKYVFLSQLSSTQSNLIKQGMTGADAQQGAADATLYDIDALVDSPALASVRGIISSVDSLAVVAKTAVTNYLQQVIAVDLGLAKGTSVATVGAALITAMSNASASVSGSGVNPSGFDNYFYTNFSLHLPTSGSPNILNSYIIDTVVA